MDSYGGCEILKLSNITDALRSLDPDEIDKFSFPEVMSNGRKRQRKLSRPQTLMKRIPCSDWHNRAVCFSQNKQTGTVSAF